MELRCDARDANGHLTDMAHEITWSMAIWADGSFQSHDNDESALGQNVTHNVNGDVQGSWGLRYGTSVSTLTPSRYSLSFKKIRKWMRIYFYEIVDNFHNNYIRFEYMSHRHISWFSCISHKYLIYFTAEFVHFFHLSTLIIFIFSHLFTTIYTGCTYLFLYRKVWMWYCVFLSFV